MWRSVSVRRTVISAAQGHALIAYVKGAALWPASGNVKEEPFRTFPCSGTGSDTGGSEAYMESERTGCRDNGIPEWTDIDM